MDKISSNEKNYERKDNICDKQNLIKCVEKHIQITILKPTCLMDTTH